MRHISAKRGVWLRGLAWAAVLLIALWILSLTLVERGQPSSINLVPFSHKLPALACLLGGCEFPGERRASAAFLFVDVLGNLAVFVPFGAALAGATFPRRSRKTRRFGPRWWLAIMAGGFLLSLGIETAQLFMRTRATDIDDVILNTLGTLIGALVVRIISSLLQRLSHD